METTVAPPAAPYPLVDLDDLHQADLDAVLAERLNEAVGSVSELAELVRRPGRDAASADALRSHALRSHVLRSHVLRSHVLLLAVF